MVKPNPRTTYKAQLLNYDTLLEASDNECSYCLSEREVQMLLAFVDYIAWKTRYIATETEIDVNLIEKWSGNLARKLMSGCCDDDQLHRFTEGGIYQSSDDGGVTWNDDPEGDPRADYIGAPPLPGSASTAKKCAAADNVRGLFEQYRDNLITIVGDTPTILAIIAGILAFIGTLAGVSGVGIGIGVLFLTMAAEMISIGGTGISAAITFTALENFRCLVYCRMTEDGELTYDAWQALLADIADTFDGFAELFFYQTVSGMGYIGVTNAGTIGASTASDCDDCDCGLDLIWVSLPGQVDAGTVEFQGEGVWRFTLGTRDFDGNLHSSGGMLDANGHCFKITDVDLVAGSYTRSYRSLCGGGEGYGTFIDVCISSLALDRYLASPQVESVIVDVTAEICA